MKLIINTLLLSIILPYFLVCQKVNYTKERPSLEIKKAKSAIKIDGIIDEID